MFQESEFPTVFNLPGSAGGETNGQYAAVTVNTMVPVDDEYMNENSPGFLDNVSGFINAARGISQSVNNAKIEQAKASVAVRRAESPSIMDQFNNLDFFGKVWILVAIGGFVYLMARK